MSLERSRQWLSLVPALLVLWVVASSACGDSAGEPSVVEQPDLLPRVEVDLVVPATARVGERIELVLRLRNPTDRLFTIPVWAEHPQDFVAYAGRLEVWRLNDTFVSGLTLLYLEVDPGEEIEHTAHWSLKDHDGNPLPPGEYRVGGIVNVLYPWEIRAEAKTILITPEN